MCRVQTTEIKVNLEALYSHLSVFEGMSVFKVRTDFISCGVTRYVSIHRAGDAQNA